MPSKYCYFYRSPEHSDAMVLSFAFCFDVEGIKDCFLISRNFHVRKESIIFEIFVFSERERYEIAMSYPYSYSRIKAIGKKNHALKK